MKKQMIKLKLNKNAKKIDQFLKRFLRKQDNSLLVRPMKYGVRMGCGESEGVENDATYYGTTERFDDRRWIAT